MPRTTDALVRGVIDADAGADLTPFIATANMLTTAVCGASGYADTGEGSQMELIERWLAAHFYSVNDNRLSAARAGSVGASFQHKVDMGLRVTVHGQQALLLDTAGNLAKIENVNKTIRKITVRGGWLGLESCGDPLRYFP